MEVHEIDCMVYKPSQLTHLYTAAGDCVSYCAPPTIGAFKGH